MSILAETSNLLRLYIHHTGTTEVPDEFHLWSCLSMIGAAVSDRVWFEKFKGSKLAPNLYVILVGPSGIGKEIAIRTASKFLEKVPRVNLYRGKVTAPSLIDYLCSEQKTEAGDWLPQNTKLFLVTPELAMSVGVGGKADDFVKFMTEIYSGDYTLREGTRMHGQKRIENPCVNWLAGTTRQWLFDSVSKEAILSGFFARIGYVEARYNLEKRVTEPSYPLDYKEVTDYIGAYVKALTRLEGVFTMSEQAKEMRAQWYKNRPAPDDEALLPSWKREDDFILKLAMVLSLADGMDLVIDKRHVMKAQQLSRGIQKKMPTLMIAAMSPREADGLQFVAKVLEENERLPHSTLLRIAGNRGIMAFQLREIMDTLRQQNLVEVVPQGYGKGGLVYMWRRKKHMDDASHE